MKTARYKKILRLVNGERPLLPPGRVVRVFACFVAIMVFAAVDSFGQQPQPAPQSAATATTADIAPAPQTAVAPPAPAQAAQPSPVSLATTKPETEEEFLDKPIAEQSASLLKMAMALKAEVDKTTQDTLSIQVIRKADEIERLAHSVRTKTQLAANRGSH